MKHLFRNTSICLLITLGLFLALIFAPLRKSLDATVGSVAGQAISVIEIDSQTSKKFADIANNTLKNGGIAMQLNGENNVDKNYQTDQKRNISSGANFIADHSVKKSSSKYTLNQYTQTDEESTGAQGGVQTTPSGESYSHKNKKNQTPINSEPGGMTIPMQYITKAKNLSGTFPSATKQPTITEANGSKPQASPLQKAGSPPPDDGNNTTPVGTLPLTGGNLFLLLLAGVFGVIKWSKN